MLRTLISSKNAAEIDRPACPRCGSLMWLRGIAKQAESHNEQRIFECPVCEVSMGDGHLDDRPANK